MALHQSLLDLTELAPRCQSAEMARGLLEESQQLLRNALMHNADETELAAWFSRLITDIVRSPGVASQARLTGAVARGDGIPSLAVEWIGEDAELEKLLASAGLEAHPVEEDIATRADAGLPLGHGGEDALLQEALKQRPPSLQLQDGLPDRNAEVSIKDMLLSPVIAIARWAAPAPRPTADRLAIGVERELLSKAEADALTLCWETGLALELRKWHSGVDDHPSTLSDLPPLDRTAYGSACRTVSETFAAITQRQK